MFDSFVAAWVLVLIQTVAMLPWFLTLTWDLLRKSPPGSRITYMLSAAGVFAGFVVALLALFEFLRDPVSLRIFGGVYGAVLQAQLLADFFVFVLWFIQVIWPKGGAVARAAFREGHRQPMFWLFILGGVVLMTVSPIFPYFTFGEDHIMVKELGFDTLMLAGVAFGVFTAGMSISDEIEGRTAVTLMSKPISRRQFLLGKFLGIYLTCLLLIGVLGWYFEVILLYKRYFDALPFNAPPEIYTDWVQAKVNSSEARDFLNGTGIWSFNALDVLVDMVKTSSQIMIMVAIAVTLATRVPLVVNLVTCVAVYLLANLMPALVQQTRPRAGQTATPVEQLLGFIAGVFDAILPALELFAVQPTLVGETPLPTRDYLSLVGSVFVYGLMFTAIVLLLGLVLFEDRDLA